ncbi:MAG TPA: hypothetical protein LFV90_02145 [Rickettsia endosymbiont of Columbicola hoogstraali]|nr:hypothetical protein [Rickettsia endosymbiont of Columbicola hoogstraali]
MKKFHKNLFFSLLIICKFNTAWALENKAKLSKDYHDTGIILYKSGQYE